MQIYDIVDSILQAPSGNALMCTSNSELLAEKKRLPLFGFHVLHPPSNTSPQLINKSRQILDEIQKAAHQRSLQRRVKI